MHPSHLILALQAHSSWSYKLHHDQKYKKNAKNHRYYKTFDKYNAEFTDKLLGHLLQQARSGEVNLKGAMLAIDAARYLNIKQRKTARLVTTLIHQTLPLLQPQLQKLQRKE